MATPATRVTVPCRISYAHIWEPGKNKDGSEGKYSVSLLIDRRDEKTLEKINKAIKAAIEYGKTKLANKAGIVPKDIKLPLRDADKEMEDGKLNPDSAYEGMMFFNASTTTKPKIVDRGLNQILDRDEVYSGCYCNVSVNFYAFAVDGNKGIAAGLGHLQKVKDGPRLGGGASVEEDFEVLEDSDDDMFS